jgi:L-threonylcarbamoyladenylate synthase
MDVLSKEEFRIEKEHYINLILEGALFIHPTDTIYGISCDATNDAAVKKVRELKQQGERPLSIIAPSKKWIIDNCAVGKKENEWIKKLPGPYTLILKLKNKKAVAEQVNFNSGTLGVRIPKHWFSEIVEEIDRPMITTSANITQEDYMTSTDDLNPRIKSKMSFAVYEGEKHSRPSTIIDLTKEEVKVVKR